MRLEQLHYLMELYRTRSFSKAAENVYITQPSLSTAISTLEEELGVKLFERMRSGVYPTPIGEKIVKAAAELLKNEEQIYDIAKNKITSPITLQLITIPAISYAVLAYLVTDFQKRYDKIVIHLSEYAPCMAIYRAAKKIQDNPGTFAICGLPKQTESAIVAKLAQDGIEALPLYEDHFVCLMGSENPHAHKDSITEEEFMEFPGVALNLLRYEAPDNFYTEMHDVGFSDNVYRLKRNINIEVDNLANLKHLVMNGGNVALMPKLICYHDKDFLANKFCALPLADKDFTLTYYLLKGARYPLKPIEKEFLEMLQNRFYEIGKEQHGDNFKDLRK